MASTGDSNDEVFVVNVHLEPRQLFCRSGERCEESERNGLFESFPATTPPPTYTVAQLPPLALPPPIGWMEHVLPQIQSSTS